MKPLYLKLNCSTFLYRSLCALFAVLILNSVNAQVIKMSKKEKQHRLMIAYKMDHFYLDPTVLMNELIWQNKFSGGNDYAEEIKYLNMAYEKIEFTYGQKEFRNMAEDKIYHHVLKLLTKLICEGKVFHIDRHTKKPSVTLTMRICEEKEAGYASLITQKGKVIFDCDGHYLPQAK
ncbi:MAG: hypothetical protein V4506_00190 [Bacteroidota bacterium]